MSGELVSKVLANGPRDLMEQHVLVVLAARMRNEGDRPPSCFPGIASIAEESRRSERHVQKVLRKLEADGWIKVETNHGRNHTNLYTLNVAMLTATKPVTGDRFTGPVGIVKPVTGDPQKVSPVTVKGVTGDTRTVRNRKRTTSTAVPLGVPSSRGPTENEEQMRHRKMRLPEGWTPDPTATTHAKATYPTVDVEESARQFGYYHAGKGDTSEDWNATFLGWVARDAQRLAKDQAATERDLAGRTDDLGFPLASAKAWHRHIS